MKTEYYIAYGSNLNLEQMAWRCPTASVVGAAMLEGYRLVFSTFATIEPQEGARVPVGLWRIDESCEEQLDIYEGYPGLYRKEYVDVSVNGQTFHAMVYIMNGGRPNQPSAGYINTVTRGYEDFGLDKSYLTAALRAV